MANMISNNNNNTTSTTKNGENSTSAAYNNFIVADSGVNLRDVCNLLPKPNEPVVIAPGVCPYDHIINMMRGLNLNDDGIVSNQKIKSIEMDFCHIVRDENMLCESMEYINDKALVDSDIAIKFAMLFASRSFDALAMNDTKLRSVMLKILETNFINADTFRIQNKDRLYNSITLLGEYYHRVRLADSTPITILGESLLDLLTREVSELRLIDFKLARVILSQVTLNGDILSVKHKAELIQLLYHIRRNIIEQPALKANAKALLLMTLDLYYSKFTNLGAQLEQLYSNYLMQADEDEGNNNADQLRQQQQQQKQHPQPPTPQQQNYMQSGQNNAHNSSNCENGKSDNAAANESYEIEHSTKKWSEQVCEDSFFENEANNCDYNDDGDNKQGRPSGGYEEQRNQGNQQTHLGHNNERDHVNRNHRRSFQPRASPRPLKQLHNSLESNNDSHTQHTNTPPPQQQQQFGGSEERDESKPLPRWRVTRFNRDAAHHDSRQHRRFSASFDDDRQSVRSEGGSIRLYSVNDRLKHSQEKIDSLNSSSNYSSIANSNWDHQSQRDDRSERSYVSNYERGTRRHYNTNRQNYDKPPRFQKNQHQQFQNPNQPNQQQQQFQNQKDNKIYSDNWRRSNNQRDDYAQRTNGPDSGSRSSSASRARTLPRTAKTKFDGGHPGSNYRRSQSPNHAQYQYQPRGRNYNNANPRYGSESSLASEASNTFDRRQQQRNRNRNYGPRAQQPHHQPQQQPQQQPQPPQQQQKERQNDWEDTHSLHGQPEEANWDTKDNNSELVRNARQTTKYMNYLSAQK